MRLLVLILLFSSTALADGRDVLKTEAAPYFWGGHQSFLSHQVLGTSCQTFRSIDQEISCNAALLGEKKDSSDFAANLFFADDYETLYKNRDLMKGENKLDLAQSLLSEEKPVRFEGSVSLWWRGESMAINYQPMRWTYYSQVSNQAYPDIVIHGLQEQSITLQAGGFLDEHWRVGMNLRFVDRKFVHESFNMFDAIPEIEKYFEVKKQKLFLLEPSLAYEIHGNEGLDQWKPLLTVQVSELGIVDKKYEEVPLKPVVDTGVSFQPPVGMGDLEIGLNYRWSSEIESERKARLGFQYKLGLAAFLAGVDANSWSLGVMSTFKNISAGLLYQRKEALNLDNDRIYEDSGAFEFRLSL